MPPRKSYYVYILQCTKGELYIGYTSNLKKRLKAHENGKGSRFTRSRLPVKLMYSEKYQSRKEAMERERMLKKKNRAYKMELIKEGIYLNKQH